MRKIKYCIITGIAVAIIVYLLASFIAGNFNPMTWNIDPTRDDMSGAYASRTIFALCEVAAIAIAVAFVATEDIRG